MRWMVVFIGGVLVVGCGGLEPDENEVLDRETASATKRQLVQNSNCWKARRGVCTDGNSCTGIYDFTVRRGDPTCRPQKYCCAPTNSESLASKLEVVKTLLGDDTNPHTLYILLKNMGAHTVYPVNPKSNPSSWSVSCNRERWVKAFDEEPRENVELVPGVPGKTVVGSTTMYFLVPPKDDPLSVSANTSCEFELSLVSTPYMECREKPDSCPAAAFKTDKLVIKATRGTDKNWTVALP